MARRESCSTFRSARARLASQHPVARGHRADLQNGSWKTPVKNHALAGRVGHIGKNHARLYAELGRRAIHAIYDTARAVAERHAAEFRVTAATSLDEFAELVEPASIATPTARTSKSAGNAHPGKHLLVESRRRQYRACERAGGVSASRGLVLQVATGHASILLGRAGETPIVRASSRRIDFRLFPIAAPTSASSSI